MKLEPSWEGAEGDEGMRLPTSSDFFAHQDNYEARAQLGRG